MPQVPTYDSFQVAQNTLPQTFATPAQGRNYAADQAQAMGQQLTQAGGEMARISMELAKEANQLRVNDAMNRVKEQALRLTYDQETGYTNLKGIDALERPDGVALADEYGEQLQRVISDVSGTLGNNQQRQAFAAQAGGLLTNFRGSIFKHESDEYRTYALSVSEGVQATALREIGLSWNDPDTIDKAVHRIKAETYRQGKLLGKSAEWQEAKAREMTSNAHVVAVGAALEQGDVLYADGYLSKYKDQIQANDLLRARGHVTKELDLQVGTHIGAQVFAEYAPRYATSDLQRAFHVALGTESGHRQFDAQGRPLTSRKGAVGIAQVMPGTAPEAAKLAGLEWDENKYKTDAAYNEALGFAYFEKQVKDFDGDIAKAFAAYNAGPGWVKKAEERARKAEPGSQESNWFWQLNNDSRAPGNRQETQNYVEKNMAAYGSGAGKAPPPTKGEMLATLRAQPELAGNPQRLKHAEARLENDLKVYREDQKQREEETLDTAYKTLYDNGGDFAALPASLRASIPGDKLNSVLTFARTVGKGTHVNNPEAWAEILSLPKTELAQMTPSEFYRSFRPFLDDAHLEKGYALLKDAQGDTGSDAKHLEIISVANRVKQAAVEAGVIPATGKAKEKELKAFADFQQMVDNRIRQFEAVDLGGKRKANSGELQNIIDHVMLDQVKVPRTLWFDFEKPAALLTDDESSRAYVEVGGEEIVLASIPQAQRSTIVGKLRARGLPVTEQAVAELWVRAGKPK